MAISSIKNNKKVLTKSEQFVFSSEEICDFFGITRATLSNWVKKGAPKANYGKYDLKALVEWKFKSGLSPETRKIQAEADLKEFKASQEEIKLGILRGEYVKTAIVSRDVRRLLTALKRSLLAIGHDVATDLNAFDSDIALEAKKIVDNRIAMALEQMAKGDMYGKKSK